LTLPVARRAITAENLVGAQCGAVVGLGAGMAVSYPGRAG
jgi:hypothetical protein